MRGIRALLAGLVVALTALFPGTASACVAITWRPHALATWDQPPEAGEGEVVVKVRLLRTEHPDEPAGDGRCYPSPSVFVFEVVSVAEGAFLPTQVFLLGSGAPSNPEGIGWLVGKPATLYTKYLVPRVDGQSSAAELPSIEWRPPPCPARFVCPPPNVRVLRP